MRKISIIYGGRSTEHDASLKSRSHINEKLDRKKYNLVDEIFVNRKGKIFINNEEYCLGSFIDRIQQNKKIFYINLLHGNEGEDGSWSGIFDICDGKGSFETVNASSILMNKIQQGDVIISRHPNQLKYPKTVELKKENHLLDIEESLKKIHSENVIIKPNKMGASHMTKKFNKDDVDSMRKLLSKIFKYNQSALIQEYIDGEEYTCGILRRKGKPTPLPVIRVRTNTGFLGHAEKHKHGAVSVEFFDNELTKRIQEISLRLFETFDIIGMCRFDFIFSKNELYFLEGNLLPGFSTGSAFPMMLKKGGIDINDWIEDMINSFTHISKDNKYLPYKID